MDRGIHTDDSTHSTHIGAAKRLHGVWIWWNAAKGVGDCCCMPSGDGVAGRIQGVCYVGPPYVMGRQHDVPKGTVVFFVRDIDNGNNTVWNEM